MCSFGLFGSALGVCCFGFTGEPSSALQRKSQVGSSDILFDSRLSDSIQTFGQVHSITVLEEQGAGDILFDSHLAESALIFVCCVFVTCQASHVQSPSGFAGFSSDSIQSFGHV